MGPWGGCRGVGEGVGDRERLRDREGDTSGGRGADHFL